MKFNATGSVARLSAKRELDGAQILANIKALQPVLQERSLEIDALRRLPDDVVDVLREAGAFRMMMPRAWGGPEMNLMQINEALEELAIGNSAAAWCAMIQMDSGLYSGLLSPDVARNIYSDIDMTTSNVLRSLGRAVKVDGGYIVNGRWPFASGCNHADWFAGGCVILDESETAPPEGNTAPPITLLLAPRHEWIIHDTWNTLGLRGTGSNDIEAIDLFVPDERAFSLPPQGCFSDGMPSRAGALYRWPAVICAKMPGVALGIARAAIESTIAIVKQRNGANEELVMALADAQTAYGAARAYLYQSLEALWADLEAGTEPSESVRTDVILARTNAFQSSRLAVQKLFDSIGGGIYAQHSGLERHLRDVNTACQHVMAKRVYPYAAAKLMLGDATDLGFV